MNAVISIFMVLMSTFIHAKVQLKWGIDNQLHHQLKIAKEFKTLVETKFPQEIEVIIKPYDAKDEKYNSHTYIQKGIYDITQNFVGEYINQAREFEIFQIPYLFKTPEHIENFLQSDKALKLLNKASSPYAKAINYSYAGGFLSYYSEKKINSFHDLKNHHCYNVKSYGFTENFLNIFGMKNTNHIDSSEYNCGELLSSELDTIYSYENAHKRWINITNHRIITRITFISKKKLKKLSPKQQQFIEKELFSALKRERYYVYDAAKLVRYLLKNRGYNVHVWGQKQIDSYLKEIAVPLRKFKDKHQELVDIIENLEK